MTTIFCDRPVFAKDNTTELLTRRPRFTIRLSEAFKTIRSSGLRQTFSTTLSLESSVATSTRFLDAEPLPRSVAAVFAQADPAKITGGVTPSSSLIPLAVRQPPPKSSPSSTKTSKRLPITKGFYLGAPRRSSSQVNRNADGLRLRYRHAGCQRAVARCDSPTRPPFIEAVYLKRVPDIGISRSVSILTESPLWAASIFMPLQQQVADIPLWRDQIPELSIQGDEGWPSQRFQLVSRGTTVKPHSQ